MTGWLIVNAFLHSSKFEEIYERILAAFSRRGIPLIRKTNAELAAVPIIPDREIPDFALFWDKDIPLAIRLEHQGILLFNSARAVALCDDKGWTALALEKSGIPTPKTIIAPLKFGPIPYPDTSFLKRTADILGFPLVVKSRVGSFGAQVSLLKTYPELIDLVQNHPSDSFIFQEYIASSFGRDIRIQTLGDRVAGSVARFGAPGDFRSNVTAGGYMRPVDPPPSFVETALAAAKHLQLDFAGIDLLYGPDETPILCEINSNAHFVNLDNALGTSFADKLADYVLNKIQEEK